MAIASAMALRRSIDDFIARVTAGAPLWFR
jgi:hypothetical protein